MQNKQLDSYMDALADRLKALSPAEREEEIREVRQHLEALALSQMQQSKNQDEAVRFAIQQFGKAEHIGSDINKVSAQEKTKGHIRLFAQVFFAWFFVTTLQFLVISFSNDKPTDFPYEIRDRLAFSAVMGTSLCSAFFFKVIKKTFFSTSRS